MHDSVISVTSVSPSWSEHDAKYLGSVILLLVSVTTGPWLTLAV
jgi:hypothetical protein